MNKKVLLVWLVHTLLFAGFYIYAKTSNTIKPLTQSRAIRSSDPALYVKEESLRPPYSSYSDDDGGSSYRGSYYGGSYSGGK